MVERVEAVGEESVGRSLERQREPLEASPRLRIGRVDETQENLAPFNGDEEIGVEVIAKHPGRDLLGPEINHRIGQV